MKVSVYKEEGGTLALLVQASPGKGRVPVLVQGVVLEDVKATTLPLIEAMRAPKKPK